MFRSLQSRVAATFVAVLALTVVALGITLSALFRQVLYTQYRNVYASNAYAVSRLVDDGLNTGGYAIGTLIYAGRIRQVVIELAGQFHVRIRMVINASNAPIIDSGAPKPLPSEHLVVDNLGTASMPITYGGATIGTLIVSNPLTDRQHAQDEFERNVIWIVLAAWLLAIFIGSVLSERLTAPFRVLTRVVTRMGSGTLSERVPEGRRDEAGELARQFNHMAERLEESFATISADRDRLRQFVADVSHELRTPLTALRTFNDLLQDGAGDDTATRRDFLGESARQIERLDWLTHNLLDLSRLDSGITRLALQRADLAETLRHAAETNRPAAAAKGVALSYEAPPLFADHDPPRLEQALNNVIGNAVKFTPPGGAVQARVYAEDGDAVVEVRDAGPGIPADEAQHIFERFYRGNAANRAGEGSGLGLAITKAIMEAHGGSIVVKSAPGQGTTMLLRLPGRAQLADIASKAQPADSAAVAQKAATPWEE